VLGLAAGDVPATQTAGLRTLMDTLLRKGSACCNLDRPPKRDGCPQALTFNLDFGETQQRFVRILRVYCEVILGTQLCSGLQPVARAH
jgi:hypothetical protein